MIMQNLMNAWLIFSNLSSVSNISNEQSADTVFLGWEMLVYVQLSLRAYPSVYYIYENVHWYLLQNFLLCQ